MKVKKESENVDLKFNIQKTKIMASGPITSWQLDGEKMDSVRFYLLLLGRKVISNLDGMLKTQTVALYQPRGVRWGGRWEGVSKGRGYMNTYG